MKYSEMKKEDLLSLKEELLKKYAEEKGLNLSLDMSRGKPGHDQLELSYDVLKVFNGGDTCISDSGIDCRNYGVLDGIPECKKLFSEILSVDPDNIIIGGSSSLNLMFDFI